MPAGRDGGIESCRHEGERTSCGSSGEEGSWDGWGRRATGKMANVEASTKMPTDFPAMEKEEASP